MAKRAGVDVGTADNVCLCILLVVLLLLLLLVNDGRHKNGRQALRNAMLQIHLGTPPVAVADGPGQGIFHPACQRCSGICVLIFTIRNTHTRTRVGNAHAGEFRCPLALESLPLPRFTNRMCDPIDAQLTQPPACKFRENMRIHPLVVRVAAGDLLLTLTIVRTQKAIVFVQLKHMHLVRHPPFQSSQHFFGRTDEGFLTFHSDFPHTAQVFLGKAHLVHASSSNGAHLSWVPQIDDQDWPVQPQTVAYHESSFDGLRLGVLVDVDHQQPSQRGRQMRFHGLERVRIPCLWSCSPFH